MIPLACLFRRCLKFQVTVSIIFSISRNSAFTSAHRYACVRAKSLQSCPTLCNPMDCRLSGSSVHGDSPGRNTGVSCYVLLQILLTQGQNPCLLCLSALAGRFFTTGTTWEALAHRYRCPPLLLPDLIHILPNSMLAALLDYSHLSREFDIFCYKEIHWLAFQ